MSINEEIEQEFSRFMNPPEEIPTEEKEPDYEATAVALNNIPYECRGAVLQLLETIMESESARNRSWLLSFAAGYLQPDAEMEGMRRIAIKGIEKCRDKRIMRKYYTFVSAWMED